MPRGYLKHEESINRKIRRGGSSHHSRRISKPNAIDSSPIRKYKPSWKDRISQQVDSELKAFVEDDACASVILGHHEHDSKVLPSTLSECVICMEERQLIKLMAKCNHPMACYECLRKIYASLAHEDISNFPLKCFHPSCDRLVQETQLVKHHLVRSEQELAKHHRLSVLRKAYAGSKLVVHCPSCDHPKYLTSVRKSQGLVCRSCKAFYEIEDKHTQYSSTIKAVENFGRDKVGRNDGWANCPQCGLIISKGDGCAHMNCICGHHFNWSAAKAKRTEKPNIKVAALKRLT